MKISKLLIGIIIMGVLNIDGKVKAQEKKTLNLEVDLNRVQKNISTSVAGYDAEDFATGVNFNWMLNEGREKLIEKFNQAGVECLRFATCGRYNFRGERQTREMIAVYYARNNPEYFKKLMNRKLEWWFKPEDFFSLCKTMNIKVIGMFDTRAFWNPEKKCAQWLPDCDDKDIRQAALDNAAFVKWLKDNSYLDLVVGWELGSEPWYAGRMPADKFIKYAKYTIEETRKISPDIQFAVPAFICSSDYPELKTVAARVKATSPEYNTGEYKAYRYALNWTTEVLKGLGEKLKEFKWAKIHTYGTSSNYNSNYYGLKRHYLLLKSQPESKHLRIMNTEWRFTAGDNPSGHRKFKIGALWNAKFLADMVAFPEMDYSGAHSLFCFSGGLYYSDGKKWVLQQIGKGFRQKGLPWFIPSDTPLNRPDIEIGAFGIVTKMMNRLIKRTPFMLSHGSENGKMSSTKFIGAGKTDVQWLIATDKEKKSIGVFMINTRKHRVPVTIKLKDMDKKLYVRDAIVNILKCKPGMLDVYEIPGKQLWDFQEYIGSEKGLELPAESVCYFWIPVK